MKKRTILENWIVLGTQWVKVNPLIKSHISGDDSSKEFLRVGCLGKMNPNFLWGKGITYFSFLKLSVE